VSCGISCWAAEFAFCHRISIFHRILRNLTNEWWLLQDLFKFVCIYYSVTCTHQKTFTCPAKGLLLPATISEVSLFCRWTYCERDLGWNCAAAGIWYVVRPNATAKHTNNITPIQLLNKINCQLLYTNYHHHQSAV